MIVAKIVVNNIPGLRFRNDVIYGLLLLYCFHY